MPSRYTGYTRYMQGSYRASAPLFPISKTPDLISITLTMSSISVADRVIASREHQRQSAYSDYEAKQTDLAAERGVDPDLYKKTFELPDKYDLEILSSRNGDIYRAEFELIFDFLTHDMAKTKNPISNNYRDAKWRLARHHSRYGVRSHILTVLVV